MSPDIALKTLASEWAEYAQLVLAADAPPIQRAETKRAFYAGAYCTLSILGSIDQSGSDGLVVGRLALRLESLIVESLNFTRARLAADAAGDVVET